MAYLIPIIANRRKYHRSAPGAAIAGLIIFLALAVMFFLLFNRSGVFGFDFSIIFWIGGLMIFFAIILAISAAISASSMSKNTKARNGNTSKQQIIVKKPTIRINPYKVPTVEKETQTGSESNSVIEIIKYCSFCGAKKDLDAIFCHMCGSKF